MAKILAVDDSRSICDLIKTVLETHGHQVTTALCGREAMEIARHNFFDIVFSDVNMPEMNGNSLVSKLRRLRGYEYIPIVMVTTEGEGYKKKKSREAGATGWLQKPISEERLLKAIEKLMA